MNENLDDMYRDIILDHYRSPRGKKPIDKIDVSAAGKNPSCGDEIEVDINIEDGTLKDIHVDCKGCAISVASASMMAELIKDKSIEQVLKDAEIVKKMLKGDDDKMPEDFDDIDSLKGVRKFPVRIKCALLAWMTLVEGIKNHQNGMGNQKAVISTEDGEI